MPTQIVKRRSRGFICVNAHPEGCRRNVERQIAVASAGPARPRGPAQRAGHRRLHRLWTGLAHCRGLGLRRAHARRLFRAAARRRQNRHARVTTTRSRCTSAPSATACSPRSINGDAFSDDCKREAIAIIRRELAPLDLVIYSLASPKRTHPRTGVAYNSALKPIGQSFSSRTIELDSEKVVDVTLASRHRKGNRRHRRRDGRRRLAHVDRGSCRGRSARSRRAHAGLFLHRPRADLADLSRRHHRPRQAGPRADRARAGRHAFAPSSAGTPGSR